MMLDYTRGVLDISSLHRATSMDISLYKKFCLLSCHRDTPHIHLKHKNGLETNFSKPSNEIYVLVSNYKFKELSVNI